MKTFVVRYECRIGDTELSWFHLAEGDSEGEVIESHEVEHDDCDLDTENSPIGGNVGQKHTKLYDVYEITPKEKKLLNRIGIH